MVQWTQSPETLVLSVPDDLADLPAMPPRSFAKVAGHWRTSPPTFRGRPIGLDTIATFMKQLLVSNPFGTGSRVPYVDFHAKPRNEKVVAITQRQLAFVVANVLMGNNIPMGNGLTATIKRCGSRGATSFIFSMLSLLAVLSQELQMGGQGTMLIGATPRDKEDSWKNRLASHIVEAPKLCHQEGYGQPCKDFMAGGEPGQALTDIAGTVVGGGAQLCDLANSQDESLVQFYSEVLAFVFFASPTKMLPVPWALLGARRYVGDITGQSTCSGPYQNKCGHIAEVNWLNEEISQAKVSVRLNKQYQQVANSAFIAVASKCSAADHSCPLAMAVNNQCPGQRHHLEQDVTNWYQAYESTMYPAPVQEAFSNVVQRIGTGPWGAGVWFGDSQQYFLAVWLATTLLGGAALDYYVYDHFCENPANQCFLLGAAACSACIAKSGTHNINARRCGNTDLEGVVERFRGKTAKELYLALMHVGPPPAQVFDLVASWHPSAAVLAQPVTPMMPRATAAPTPAASPSWPSPSPSWPSPQVSTPAYVTPSVVAPAPKPPGLCFMFLGRHVCIPRLHRPR